MKKSVKSTLAAVAVGVSMTMLAPLAAHADTSTPPPVGTGAGQSADNVYLYNTADYSKVTATSLPWGASVVGAPDATDANVPFSTPDYLQGFIFISPRGHENHKTDWNSYLAFAMDSGKVYAPSLTPENTATVGEAASGGPVGAAAVKAAGGDYSLGFAVYDNATSTIKYESFLYITVTAGTGDWTYSTPAPAATAPAITTQPADKTVLPGQSAVFTAAASGSPAPTVKWQSSTDGTTWSDVAGATSDTLTVSNVQLAQSGTKYQAVYTNSAGTATTSAATLTVTNVVPTEPTGSDAGKVTIADPADGATTVTIPAGVGLKAQTLTAWGWSTATNLGQVTADATSGDVVVNIATLAPGAHTIALTQPGSSTVVVWGTFTVPVPSYPAKTDTVDLQAAVTASDLWSLNAAQTAIDFGNVARNASSTKSLGKVTVIDDRKVLKGWTLDAAWSKFTAGSDEIPASALTITPKAFDNGSLLPGVTLGTNGTKIAESTAVSTLTDGALLDADLKFVAPKDAAAGQYHSTLTLTLTSK